MGRPESHNIHYKRSFSSYVKSVKYNVMAGGKLVPKYQARARDTIKIKPKQVESNLVSNCNYCKYFRDEMDFEKININRIYIDGDPQKMKTICYNSNSCTDDSEGHRHKYFHPENCVKCCLSVEKIRKHYYKIEMCNSITCCINKDGTCSLSHPNYTSLMNHMYCSGYVPEWRVAFSHMLRNQFF